MKRSEKLLLAAADAFSDGRSPFETEWLSEHNVTFTECMDLSEDIGSILRSYVGAPTFVKEVFPTFDTELPEAVKEMTLLEYARARLNGKAIRELEKFNEKRRSKGGK